MMPLLREGQKVLLHADFDARALRPGDILAVASGEGRVVLHRLIRRAADGLLLTRGDNCPQADPLCRAEDVMGRVISMESASGRWLAEYALAARLLVWHHALPSCRLRYRLRQLIGRNAWRSAARPEEFLKPHARLVLCGEDENIPEGGEGNRYSTQPMGHEWAVYDSETGDFHILNRTAYRVWSLAREGRAPEAIQEALLREFAGADPAQVAKDVKTLMADLSQKQLLAK